MQSYQEGTRGPGGGCYPRVYPSGLGSGLGGARALGSPERLVYISYLPHHMDSCFSVCLGAQGDSAELGHCWAWAASELAAALRGQFTPLFFR